jgi:hypothetical protein
MPPVRVLPGTRAGLALGVGAALDPFTVFPTPVNATVDGAALDWPLDAVYGATDQSPNGRNGSAGGGISIGAYSPGPTPTHGATDFDGSNDYVEIPSYTPCSNAGTQTFTGWANRDNTSAVHTLFAGNAASNYPWLALDTGNQNVRFNPQNGVATETIWTDAWPGNSQWVHWALVFDPTADSVSLYINGALVSTKTQATDYNAAPGNFIVGCFPFLFFPFDGKMAGVKVYERGLVAREVQNLYELGPPLVLLSDVKAEVVLSPATETDSAVAQSVRKPIHVSLTPAVETDAAQAAQMSSGAHHLTLTPATEADAPVALSVRKPIHKSLTPATETDVAQGQFIRHPIHVILVPATETDTAGAQLVHVFHLLSTLLRERPPLFESIDIATPSGRHYRWASDELDPARVPDDVVYGDVMPGGDDSFECKLPRKAEIDYADLAELSTITVHDHAGEALSTTRLEKSPRVSGDEFAIVPQAVGYKEALEGNKLAAEIYVDKDLSHWAEATTRMKLEAEDLASHFQVAGPSVDPDEHTGVPALVLKAGIDTWGAGTKPLVLAVYDGGSCLLAYTNYRILANPPGFYLNSLDIGSVDTPDSFSGAEYSGDLTADVGGPAGSFTPAEPRRVLFWEHYHSAFNAGVEGVEWLQRIGEIAVYGDQGLTPRGDHPDDGLYASDVIAHLVGKYCPELDFSTGPDGTIKPSTFVHHQLEFREPTSPAEMVKFANRVHLNDWFVRGRTFYYEPRGTSGRRWHARVGPSKLEETGSDVQRRWNGIGVRYTDVDGSTKSVGPPGSGAMIEEARLADSDPENPWNKRGVPHYQTLEMGKTSTAAIATEVGVRFLEESALIDRSGQATIVGHIQDDRGVWHPYNHVRSGDEISFVDAADTSYRRIVKAEKRRSSRSCSISLDAPPAGLDALLERLGASLTHLGLS